jgi:hypothetical protein
LFISTIYNPFPLNQRTTSPYLFLDDGQRGVLQSSSQL